MATSLPLSMHRAFVVEFHADADLLAGRVMGRVEHVVSGRATSFWSQETLMIFMTQILHEARGDSDQMSRGLKPPKSIGEGVC